MRSRARSAADGAYNAALMLKTLIGSGKVVITGNTTTPANVTITLTGADQDCLGGEFYGVYQVEGFKLSATGTAANCMRVYGKGASLKIKDIDFGAAAVAHIRADSGATIEIIGDYAISGGAGRHIFAQKQAVVWINPSFFTSTVTLSGTPAFAQFFVQGQDLALVRLPSSAVTYSGAATGARYKPSENSVIDSSGGGASFFPGDAAGSTATGGQYV